MEEITDKLREQLKELVDCEIDCIKSGNTLTPREQEIAIRVCKNIIKRIKDTKITEEGDSE